MVLAIAATACAAGLVFYLQHRAIAALQAQTRVILRQISELTAADVAQEMRQALDGPVFETLTAVNHPDLRAGRLDLVAEQFERGLQEYPHVDRFFAWLARTDGAARGEVLFYGRGRPFVRDAELGRAIVELAHRYAPTQQIYVAAEGVGPGRQLAFLRLFWEDARRVDYFAILGFVVDPRGLGERLFEPPHRAHLDALVARRGGGDVPLQVRVKDDGGRVVLGRAATGTVAATQAFPMLFYPPDDIQSRLAAAVEPRSWSIEVLAPDTLAPGVGPSLGYWPTLVSIGLMLVALAITVQAYRRSQELAAMQADFVSHVSHQLKTPLSALSAATETLQLDRVRSPEKLSQYLGIIATETARLTSLVQRVLEFSRVQQPRRYEFQSVELGTLAAETVEAFARGVSGAPVTFRVEADGPGPVVRADPAALEQVLVNLLDNAVKYSDAVRDVTVGVRMADNQAVIDVSDRGVGIQPGDKAHIFERFYRGTASSRRQGFGLGLPIVRELVRAHGGQVGVTSVPGAGSTFSVTLPCEPAARGDTIGVRSDVSEAAS
jgi:two-component system phosphate regulon sensor histidine kinase PhoR